MRQGIDTSNPTVQLKIIDEAVQDSLRATYLQDSGLSTMFKRALSAGEQIDKKTGKPMHKGLSTAARLAVPIVKIPVNFIGETFQTQTGLITGSYKLARAFHRGIETLKPEEADLIMRHLKKGSLGGAAFLLGYFNADNVGGIYQPGQKPGKTPFGSIKVYGHVIPPYLLANPVLMCVQLGATVKHIHQTKLKGELQNLPTSIAAATAGLLHEIPIPQMPEPRNIGKVARNYVRDMLEPGFLQEAAQYFDTDKQGNKIQRKADTLVETLKAGVPGLRQTLPRRPKTTFRP
jgi:hypothetical protein